MDSKKILKGGKGVSMGILAGLYKGPTWILKGFYRGSRWILGGSRGILRGA